MRYRVLIAPVAAFVAWTTPVTAQSFNEGTAKANCEAEWGDDYSMVAYCVDQQRPSGSQLDRLRADLEPEFVTSDEMCREDWGEDLAMVLYCLEEQISAYGRIPSVFTDVPEDVRDRVMGRCEGDWGSDYSMVAYCASEQVKAWKSLNN